MSELTIKETMTIKAAAELLAACPVNPVFADMVDCLEAMYDVGGTEEEGRMEIIALPPYAEDGSDPRWKLLAAAPDLARLALAQAEELARLREVLAWFADEKNWYGLPDFESGWFCPASLEGRGRARAALAVEAPSEC